MTRIIREYVKFVPVEVSTFTNMVTGLVPASGGGTANFLRADGTWAAPTASTVLADGTYGQITISSTGTVFTINSINQAIIQEYVEDIIGTKIIAGTNVTVSYNDTTGETTINSSGGSGVSDGDKGDITVSGSGTTWTIDNSVVTTSKLGGDITTAGKALLDDADASAQRTTLGLGTLATQSGTFSGTSSGTNTGDQNLFSTIAVSGQSDVVADTASDTLTLVAGSNVTITTNASTDTITIAASGGGGGLSDADYGDITVSGTGTVMTIDNDVVTYAKIQNVSATDKLLGRSTAGAGDIEEIVCTAAGRAILDDADATAQRTTLGLGTLATQSGTFSGTSSGTNTGDQTITLTSDVTGSGTGSFTTTIAAGAVSLSKMANMATASILGRNTAGTGSPEVLSAATTKTLLSLNNVENTALSTWAGSTNLNTFGSASVTLANMANMSTASLLGRNTAGTGSPEVLSASTAKTLLSLNNVENTALSTWAGSTNLTTIGTISTGTWNATAIGLDKGGTGVALTDPNADRLMFWDDSAGQITWLTLGTNLSITGTTINASGGGGGGLSDGDYGDIVVSGTGTIMTIDSTATVQVAEIGIGSTTSGTNVLQTNGDILFDADGAGDCNVSYNKDTAGDNAQFFFNNNYSTRAIIGLQGDDNLTIKMSPDGSTYKTAMVVDDVTGQVQITQGATGIEGLSGLIATGMIRI